MIGKPYFNKATADFFLFKSERIFGIDFRLQIFLGGLVQEEKFDCIYSFILCSTHEPKMMETTS
jgi:hypothetical protein